MTIAEVAAVRRDEAIAARLFAACHRDIDPRQRATTARTRTTSLSPGARASTPPGVNGADRVGGPMTRGHPNPGRQAKDWPRSGEWVTAG
ncbi:MAG: hypothetical protein JXA57_11365 [Armatimonadetes bacterium]|nr:hypothetical protein [Armatimonadota bacterium]